MSLEDWNAFISCKLLSIFSDCHGLQLYHWVKVIAVIDGIKGKWIGVFVEEYTSTLLNKNIAVNPCQFCNIALKRLVTLWKCNFGQRKCV